MVSLEVEHLSKSFGPIKALNDVSFNIRGKGITSIVGTSGAGKTTLLRLIAGLEEPSRGRVLLDGRPETPPTLRKRATLVFQKSVMFSSTVYENLAYGLRIRGVPSDEIRQRVEEVLKLVRLERYGGRTAKKLSGGEQQRVSLARALILQPEVLLLDEPTANLDSGNAGIIESILKETALHRMILLATHNLSQALRLATGVIHLCEGSVVEQGPSEDLLSNPRDERTRRLINGQL
jgi:tungstate transport system ATP-binding protein